MTTSAAPAAAELASVSEAERAAYVAAAGGAEYAEAAAMSAEFLADAVGPVRAVAIPGADATIQLQPIGRPLSPAEGDALKTVAVAALLAPTGFALRKSVYAVRPLNRRKARLPRELFVGEVTRDTAAARESLAVVAGCLTSAMMSPRPAAAEESPAAAVVIDAADAVLAAAPRDEPLAALADGLQQRFGGRVVALLCPGEDDPGEWSAVAPAAASVPDELRTAVEAAADEVRGTGGPVAWPPESSLDRPAKQAVSHAAVMLDEAADATLFVPVADEAGRCRCVLVLSGPSTADFAETPAAAAERLHAALSPTLGMAVRSQTLAREGVAARLWRTAGELLDRRAWQVGVCTLVAAGVLLASPWTYHAKADCVLEPSVRRFVPAPFDGTLREVDADPGDLVVAGQRLALIDPRETEWERAGLDAEIAQARKRRDAATAAGELAAAQAAQFEMDRLAAKRDLLADRAERLEVRAPIDGIVVAGDLDRSRGVPVETGRTLFEVAPLETMVCEVEVPEYDFAQVREGQPVSVTLDAFPAEAFSSTVLRVRPRAETRGGGVVFVAEVEVSDPAGRLRPGMTGEASVQTDRHPLAWNLFHRAAGRWRRGW